jgi:hypothetical protein
MAIHFVRAAAAVAGATAGAWGQCQPQWDVAPGNPGIGGGYAAPVRGWDDGTGARLYVGGSFTSGAPPYLARWNPATGAWSSLGGGIGAGFTNAFMTSLVPFNPGGGERLVAGGFFDNAGGVAQTASLAMWNGTAWQAMGTTWTGGTRGSIWSMATWNGRLYVGGGVVNQPGTIAGLPWAGLASWDGQEWLSHITSIAGFSPYVAALQVFNDGSGEALYAAGRFSSIEGVANTALIARWNGTAWTAVGTGLTSTSTLFGLEGLTVFDDGGGAALYAAGYAFTGAGPVCNVAKWNGQTWSAIGGQVGTGRLTAIAVFDDGGGSKLYVGGTAMPLINYIARWENSTWTPVGGGVTGPGLPPSTFPSVFGLGAWQGKLYVAGNFSQVNNVAAAGLAAWTSCTGSCYANCDGSTTPPVLNVADFTCFLNRFFAGDSYANCDGSTTPPVLNVGDFGCFLNVFSVGCT